METKPCWDLSTDSNKLDFMEGRRCSIMPALTLTPWPFFGGKDNEWKDLLALVQDSALLVLLAFSWEEKDRPLLLTFPMHQEEERQFNTIKNPEGNSYDLQ